MNILIFDFAPSFQVSAIRSALEQARTDATVVVVSTPDQIEPVLTEFTPDLTIYVVHSQTVESISEMYYLLHAVPFGKFLCLVEADQIKGSQSPLFPTQPGWLRCGAPKPTAEAIIEWYQAEPGDLSTNSVQQVLLESEKRYRIVSEISSDFAFSLRPGQDGRLRFEWLTAAFQRITGYSQAEIESQGGWTSIVHPDDLALALQHLSRLNSGHSDTREYRIVTKSGVIRWLRTYSRPIIDPHTNLVTQIYGASQDVTEINAGRLLEALMHQLDQMVLQELPLEDIVSYACTRLTSLFSYSVVWVGLKEQNGSIGVKGYSGLWARDCLSQLPLVWEEKLETIGLAGLAITSGKPQLARPTDLHLWHWRKAGRYGVRSAIALPLIARGQTVGVLNIYASQKDAFNQHYLSWLEALATRIAIALLISIDRLQLRLQSAALESAANAIIITNESGNIEWVNAAFTKFSGYTAAEVAGKNPRILRSEEHPRAFFEKFWETLMSGQVWHGELINRRKDGTLYTVRQTVIPLLNQHNAITHFVAVQEDITQQREEEARMVKMAYYDPLTNLPNRTLFQDRLRHALLQGHRNDWRVGVLFVDLDRFKRINDTLGHDAGDQLITEVARRLSTSVRRSDSVARLGGDEFTVILPDLQTAEGALIVAEKIISALSEPILLKGHQVHITASVGIALFPDHAADADGLVTRADIAMYEAKQRGKNTFALYEPGMDLHSDTAFILEHSLPKALQSNQFMVDYQPVFNVESGQPAGIEASLYWKHKERGPLAFAQFVDLAEQSGTLKQIMEWYLQTVIHQFQAWADQVNPEFRFILPIPVASLCETQTIERLRDLVQEFGLSFSWLEIALQESELVSTAGTVQPIFEQLRAEGVNFSLRGFGVGNLPLATLHRLNLHQVSLDSGLMAQLGESESDAILVSGLIELLHHLGMKVGAEGVETEAQIKCLKQFGCDELKGKGGEWWGSSANLDLMIRKSATGEELPFAAVKSFESSDKPLRKIS
ncbi:MAG: diguanylate cyclase [Acidobacteria bacterium]|nr:diguanylate cyclase [Acidobacteriota bacterium]